LTHVLKKTLITFSLRSERVEINVLLLEVRKRLGNKHPNPIHAHQMYGYYWWWRSVSCLLYLIAFISTNRMDS